MSTQNNIAFSSATPAPPSGYRNAVPQQGGTDPTLISQYVPNAGGITARTGTVESIGIAELGKGVTLSNAAAIAVTLDSTVPTHFICAAMAIGAGTATLTPSSGNINGVANLALTTGQSAWLFFDGTNWWAFVGAATGGGGGGSLTSVVEEQVAGTADGSNPTFTVAHTPSSGTFRLFTASGLRLRAGVGYTRAGATITMQAGYIPAVSGEKPYADYAY